MAGRKKQRESGGLRLHDPRRHKWPMEKWPREMLIQEVMDLRRNAEKAKEGGPSDAERQELVDSLERAQARTQYVERELRALREDAAAQGFGADEIAGKPALAKYFSTWEQFKNAVWNLANVRRAHGMEGVEMVQERLMRMLFTLGVVGPRGDWEAGMDDLVIRGVQDKAFVGVLAWGEPWSDRFVARYLRVAAKTVYRRAVWAIYEKSSEMGAVDRYGGATVVK